jgi:mycothiol system anti-sigma-R factor
VTDFSSTSGPESSAGAEPQIKSECADLIAEVAMLLDGECTEEKQAKLRQHLEDCPQFYGLEERIKMLISTKCRGERAPEGLRERLRLEISRTTIIRGR